MTHTFPPDPAAVGQHMGDLATALAQRGHRVTAITADRGYDDPRRVYPRDEVTRDGATVKRLPFTSFGKSSPLRRAAAVVSFMAQTAVALLTERDLGAVVFSTSPPFVGLVTTTVARLRGVPTIYWAMDLNPDQLIALGKLREHGVLTRLLRAINRDTIRHAALVIALDRLMAARLDCHGVRRGDIAVIPPWSPDDSLVPVPRSTNPFRRAHGLDDAVVVMYSGNHTPSNPLTTLLDAAVALRDHPRLRFVFVGNGLGKAEVEAYIRDHRLSNVLSLPYQPREALGASLSAADVHVVSLGDPMAGVIHPCKVYGAMAAGRPVLYLGPTPSHVSELLDRFGNGWRVAHGDVSGTVRALTTIASTPAHELDEVGRRGRDAVLAFYQPAELATAVASAIEDRLQRAPDR